MGYIFKHSYSLLKTLWIDFEGDNKQKKEMCFIDGMSIVEREEWISAYIRLISQSFCKLSGSFVYALSAHLMPVSQYYYFSS